MTPMPARRPDLGRLLARSSGRRGCGGSPRSGPRRSASWPPSGRASARRCWRPPRPSSTWWSGPLSARTGPLRGAKNIAVRAYKGLSRVERAFRCFKGVDLKVRPVHHRLEGRVRAHVFLCMLAYYVEWHMRRALAPLLFDDDDPAAAEAARSSPVAPARRSPSARAKAGGKRTPRRGQGKRVGWASLQYPEEVESRKGSSVADTQEGCAASGKATMARSTARRCRQCRRPTVLGQLLDPLLDHARPRRGSRLRPSATPPFATHQESAPFLGPLEEGVATARSPALLLTHSGVTGMLWNPRHGPESAGRQTANTPVRCYADSRCHPSN